MYGALLLKVRYLDRHRLATSEWTLLAELMGTKPRPADEESKRLGFYKRHAGFLYLDWKGLGGVHCAVRARLACM